jgi:diadenosine tetraphosphatase ApaH/serine/threonine PP2A family protein phosphatase
MTSRNSINKEISKKELLLILPKIDRNFELEPAVLKIDANPIMIVGDIHGDLHALNFILEERDKLGCQNILFLGDYVDRGDAGIEVLIRLFQLKIEDPEHVFLHRGNHEFIEMNLCYGFFEEIGFDQEFLFMVNRTYEKMPVAAVLSGHTFCVHGGINGTGSIGTITKEDSDSYLWNDPSKRPGLTASMRGSTVREFGPDIVEGFLKTNKLKRIVRGHTALEKGYKWWFGKKLLSIFSCPNYVGWDNDGAFALLEKGEIKLFAFKNV